MLFCVAIRPAAAARAVGKEAQAQPTSKPPAFTAPIFRCTTTLVDGVMKSGESVPTKIMSTSVASTPARASAWRPARAARSLVASSSLAAKRRKIPLFASMRSTKSGAICAKRSRSTSLEISISGRYDPVERTTA